MSLEEMLDAHTRAFFRVHGGRVVYARATDSDFELTPEIQRRVTSLGELPALSSLVILESQLSPDEVAIVRFLKSGALVAICDHGEQEELRRRLVELEPEEFLQLGAGLSAFENGDVEELFAIAAASSGGTVANFIDRLFTDVSDE